MSTWSPRLTQQRPNATEQLHFNEVVNNELIDGKSIRPYTWIYRWETPTEFEIRSKDQSVEGYKEAIVMNSSNTTHSYFKKIMDTRPYIVVYHVAGPSTLKHCADVDHFHMLTWHSNHPTCEHSYVQLKKQQGERTINSYGISCQRIYNPYGLAAYLEAEPNKRMVVAAGNLRTSGQIAMYKKITRKPLITPEPETSHSDITGKSTLRGQKYMFVLDIMRKCNSTDMARVMLFCKQSGNRIIRETLDHIFTNTQNMTPIMQAAASDLQIQTKVTPIYEQIRQKKDLFSNDTVRYWSVQRSLDIYDAWADYSFDAVEFGRRVFEVCHMIRAKKNALHITGPSNSGKSYVLRSVRNGLMNCGRMRCQASDNFTFGSCVDKTLIYTDEMWFTQQNVEEGKCILEGTSTVVNVKHQAECDLERTPSLSTSDDDPWRHVPQEKGPMENRMFLYETRRPMPQLKGWGVRELNPTMWLTIWRDYVLALIQKRYQFEEEEAVEEPLRSKKFTVRTVESLSPEKQATYNTARKRLFAELESGAEVQSETLDTQADDSMDAFMADRCVLAEGTQTQYWQTHCCKMTHCGGGSFRDEQPGYRSGEKSQSLVMDIASDTESAMSGVICLSSDTEPDKKDDEDYSTFASIVNKHCNDFKLVKRSADNFKS